MQSRDHSWCCLDGLLAALFHVGEGLLRLSIRTFEMQFCRGNAWGYRPASCWQDGNS